MPEEEEELGKVGIVMMMIITAARRKRQGTRLKLECMRLYEKQVNRLDHKVKWVSLGVELEIANFRSLMPRTSRGWSRIRVRGGNQKHKYNYSPGTTCWLVMYMYIVTLSLWRSSGCWYTLVGSTSFSQCVIEWTESNFLNTTAHKNHLSRPRHV